MSIGQESRNNYSAIMQVVGAAGYLIEHEHLDIRPKLVSTVHPDNIQFTPASTDNWSRIAWRRLGDGRRWWVIADFCVAPKTLILRADLTWIPALDIRVGERVVAFDESLDMAARVRSAAVTAKRVLRQPCYRVITDRGTVEASAGHRWVRADGGDSSKRGRRRYWTETRSLRPGQRLYKRCETWGLDDSHAGGYLSGFFDGEGYVSQGGQGAGFGQNHGGTLEHVLNLLSDRGFALTGGDGAAACKKYNFSSTWEAIRFLGSVRPQRLLRNFRPTLEDGCLAVYGGKTDKWATILAVEPVGEQWVIGLETEAGTLIADGFLSHNSQIVDPFLDILPTQTKKYLTQLAANVPAGNCTSFTVASAKGMSMGMLLLVENLDPTLPNANFVCSVLNVNQSTGVVQISPLTVPAVAFAVSRVSLLGTKSVTLTCPTPHRAFFEALNFGNPLNVLVE